MKKVKEKFINWFKIWLGITNLEKQILDLQNANAKINKENAKIIGENKALKNQFNQLFDKAEVGVDIHHSKYRERDRSWAVICLKGKIDYIQFIGLPETDIRRIADFLRPFHRDKSCVDAPWGYADHLKYFTGW